MSLEQIGQKLKAARDNSGLSLSQIQERTKIPFNHLEALDTGSFDDLPEPVYVAGFIRRYAECIGLDGQQLADQYRTELDASSNKPAKSGGLFSKSPKNRDPHPIQNVYHSRQPIDQGPPNLIKLIPFYALWVVLILGLIIYLVNRQESNDLAQQEPAIATLRQSTNNLATANVVLPVKQPGQANDQTVVTGTDNQSEANSGRITLRAKNHVWVEVKAVSSGEALFTGFLETGDSRDFYDKEGLHVRAGNGGNVIIVSAGNTTDLGVPGKIAEKTFVSKVNSTSENKTETIPKDDVNNAKPSVPSVAQKKTEPVLSKKPLPVTPRKARSWHQDIPGKGYEEGSESNKSLDVPYRYSE